MKNLILTLVMLLCVGAFADSYDCFLRGDANGDGSLNIADVQVVAPYVMGNWEGPLNDNLDALDGNDDGFINIADASYIGGILFQQYPWFAPNDDTGPGTDPTPDNNNNEGGEDEGDYLAGESVSHYAPSAAIQVMAIVPGPVDWWPDHETEHMMIFDPPPTQDWFSWRYMTNPAGLYGVLGNNCVFHSGAEGMGADALWDITGVIGTANKIRRVCTDDAKNSGPGIGIPYGLDWMLKAEQPSLEAGLTKLIIDGRDVVFTFTFGAYPGHGPRTDDFDFDVTKSFDLGKYGLAVYAYYRAMVISTGSWGADWDNSSNNVTSTPGGGYFCEGTTTGNLTVTTKEIGAALPANIPNSHFIYLRAVGAFDLEHGLEVWHSPVFGDASEYDEAQCLLKLQEPERITTSWEN